MRRLLVEPCGRVLVRPTGLRVAQRGELVVVGRVRLQAQRIDLDGVVARRVGLRAAAHDDSAQRRVGRDDIAHGDRRQRRRRA